MTDITREFKPFKTQYQFLKSNAKQVLYSGGFGNGKSTMLCIKMLQQALIPNNLVFLCRKTLTSLKSSTLSSLIEPQGNFQPLLPQGSYKMNRQDHYIDIHGGGRIMYGGLDVDTKIRSLNLGGVYIDEASELLESDWRELKYRLRNPLGSRQICAVTNPSNQNHFLYNIFFSNANKDTEVIIGNSNENTYLPADYISDLNSLTGIMKQKYVEGLWVALEDAIYPNFDRNKNIIDKNDSEFKHYMIGLDYGFKNHTAALLVGYDGESLHCIEEYYHNKKLNSEIVQDITDKFFKYTKDIVIDPSASGLIAEFMAKGFNVIPAKNPVEPGIELMRDKINSANFTINSQCVTLIKQLENYSYDKKTHKPIKIEDHLCDASRYLTMQLLNNKVQELTRPRAFATFIEYDE